MTYKVTLFALVFGFLYGFLQRHTNSKTITKLIITLDIDGMGPPFSGPLQDLSKDVIFALFWLTYTCQTHMNIWRKIISMHQLYMKNP